VASGTPSSHGDVALPETLGAWVTGVALVTTHAPDGRVGALTLTSFAAVSFVPPMVLWSLDHGSSSYDLHAPADHFAVHLLAADQEALCWHCARRGADRLDGLTWSPGPGGVPLLPGVGRAPGLPDRRPPRGGRPPHRRGRGPGDV
jgi:3-hydroxy-9,10-secoandrosta-1,3,5(10)-triene-9,17-dione monooxygenase reductase component